MYEINLLPWREAREIWQNKVLCIILVAGVFVSISAIGCVGFYQYHVKNQLEESIADAQLTLKTQAEIIKKLSSESTFLNSETKQLPIKKLLERILKNKNLLCFTHIASDGGKVKIEGESRSVAEINYYLQSIDLSDLNVASEIKSITRKNNNTLRFKIDLVHKH